MDYSKIWKSICDSVWICTTTKYVNDPNRVPATLRELQKLHIPDDMIHLNIMPHGSHETGHLSCTANHIEVMKRARANNHQQILVFEDDIAVYKTTNINECLETLKNFVQTNTFDILYLGCFAHKMEKGIHRYRVRKASCYATHGYLIRANLMDQIKVLSPYDIRDHATFLMTKKHEGTFEKVCLTTPEHPSIDIWLILMSDANLIQSYAIYPTLLYQKSLPGTIVYKYSIEPFISTFGDVYTSFIFMCIFILLVIMIVIILVISIKYHRQVKQTGIQ